VEHVYSLPGSAQHTLQTPSALNPSSCRSTPSNPFSRFFARLTLYPGTSLSDLHFKRDVSPQVFAGLIREPKYGHLAALHSALRTCEAALLAVDEPLTLQLGPSQEVSRTGPHRFSVDFWNVRMAWSYFDIQGEQRLGYTRFKRHVLKVNMPRSPEILVKEVGEKEHGTYRGLPFLKRLN
jgi:hypothetical protein